MQLFHASPAEITTITKNGRFGEFLFFGDNASHRGKVAYSIEINAEEIIDANSFFFRDDWKKLDSIVTEVMKLADCDEDQAQELLSQREYHDDAEIDWDIQALTAKAAKVLGFRGVEVPDESGVSWMIDMLGFETQLVRV